MKKFFAHAALAAAALFSVGAANAYVIDFENIDTSSAPFAPQLSDWDYVQQGQYLVGTYDQHNRAAPDGSLTGFVIDGTNCLDGHCPAGNPSTYLASVNDSAVFMYSGGVGMKLSSFDAAFLGPVSSSTTAAFLVIEADYAGGGYSDGYFSLKINADGSTSFSHFLTKNATMFDGLASDFTTRKDITNLYAYAYYCDTGSGCSLAGTNKGQFGLDNISVTSVPEPSSWLLMGLGLVGVAAQVRRRRAI